MLSGSNYGLGAHRGAWNYTLKMTYLRRRGGNKESLFYYRRICTQFMKMKKCMISFMEHWAQRRIEHQDISHITNSANKNLTSGGPTVQTGIAGTGGCIFCMK